MVGQPGIQGPEGRRGVAGPKGSVIAGLGLNNIDIHSNQFVQHRTVRINRPVVIIEQPIYLFQRIVRP